MTGFTPHGRQGKQVGLRVALRVLLVMMLGVGCAWGAAPKKPVKKPAVAGKKTASKTSSRKPVSQKRDMGRSHASARGKAGARGRAAVSGRSAKSAKGKKRVEVQPFHPRYSVARPVGPLPVAPETMRPSSLRDGRGGSTAGLSTSLRSVRDDKEYGQGQSSAQESGAGRVGQEPIRQLPSQQPVPEPDERTQAPGEGAPVPETPAAVVDSSAAEALLAPAGAQPFRNVRQLDQYFAALQTEQAAKASGAQVPTVRALQFGDSHTAADMFSGEMRAQLQARFGNGGLGYQFPGHPFAGYKLVGSQRAQTSGWVTQGNRFTQLGDGDTGLGGIAILTERPGESVFVTTTCETLQVQYLRQPGGGAMDFSDNGQPVSEIHTASDGDARSAGTFTYACSPGEHEFQLITMDAAPVRLLGWVTEQPGVTWECLGINGAVAPLILRWNQQMFSDYLAQRNPQLIVLAYGTNEASNSDERNAEYTEQFRQVVQTLHRVAPQASVLVLGPYDRSVKVGRGRHASWQTSTAIDRVIADQQAVCRTDGCAFYDQRARMGGRGSMMRWAAQGMAAYDHVHLAGAGYRVLADALYRDLMSAYNNYLQAHPSATN